MLKSLLKKANTILIGAVIGLFVGVSIQQVTGQTGSVTTTGATCENAICVPAGESAQWRAGNLILNTSNQYANGLLVPYGNVGIGTITPQAKLDVVGKIKTSQGFCINDVCVNKWDDLKAILGTGGNAGDPFAGVSVATSVTPSGPFGTNAVCNDDLVYTRTTGVNRSNPPKGCAAPSGSDECADLAKHRAFTSSEWVDDATIQTVVSNREFPIGNYDIYLSYGSVAKKVGVISLKSCRIAKYEWVCAVAGPDRPDASYLAQYACGAGNVGQHMNDVPTEGGNKANCTCLAR